MEPETHHFVGVQTALDKLLASTGFSVTDSTGVGHGLPGFDGVGVKPVQVGRGAGGVGELGADGAGSAVLGVPEEVDSRFGVAIFFFTHCDVAVSGGCCYFSKTC